MSDNNGSGTWRDRLSYDARRLAEIEEIEQQNEILIIQAGENEIKMTGQAETIRDLTAQLAEANILLKYVASYPCEFCAGFTTNHDIDCEYAAYLTKWSIQVEP